MEFPNIRTQEASKICNNDRLQVSVLINHLLVQENSQLKREIEKNEEMMKLLLDVVFFCKKCHKHEDKYNRDYHYHFCTFCDKQGLCQDCELIEKTGILCPYCQRQWSCMDCYKAGRKWAKCDWCEIE